MATWYADAAVSSGGLGTLASPWPVQYAASGGGGSVVSTDTVRYRGTYINAFGLQINVNASHYPYLGEHFKVIRPWRDAGQAPLVPDVPEDSDSPSTPCLQVNAAGATVGSNGHESRFEVTCSFDAAGIRNTHLGPDGISIMASNVTLDWVYVSDSNAGVTAFGAAGGWNGSVFSFNTGLDEPNPGRPSTNYGVYCHSGTKTIRKSFIRSIAPRSTPLHFYGNPCNWNVLDTVCVAMAGQDFQIADSAPGSTVLFNNAHLFGATKFDVGTDGYSTDFEFESGSIIRWTPTETPGNWSGTEFKGTYPRIRFRNSVVHVNFSDASKEVIHTLHPSFTTSNFDGWANNKYYTGAGSPFTDDGGGGQMGLAAWQAIAGETGSTVVNGPPVDSVTVIPTGGDTALVVISNFQAVATSVAITPTHLAGFLTSGQTWKLYASDDPFGSTVATGTYSGANLTAPMNHGRTPSPQDWTASPDPAGLPVEYQVFILTRTAGGGGGGGPQTLQPSGLGIAVNKGAATLSHVAGGGGQDFGNAFDTDNGTVQVDFPDVTTDGAWSLGMWFKRANYTDTDATLVHMRDQGGNTGGEIGLNSSGEFYARHYTSEDVSLSDAIPTTDPVANAWTLMVLNFNTDGTIDMWMGDEDTVMAEVSYASNVDAGTGWRAYGFGGARYTIGSREDGTRSWAVGAGDGFDHFFVGSRVLTSGEIEDIRHGTFPATSWTTHVLLECEVDPPVDTGDQTPTVTENGTLVLMDGPVVSGGGGSAQTLTLTGRSITVGFGAPNLGGGKSDRTLTLTGHAVSMDKGGHTLVGGAGARTLTLSGHAVVVDKGNQNVERAEQEAPVGSAASRAFILAAIEDDSTDLTAFVEIYESDGTTLWRGSDQLGFIDGSVSVKLGEAERRMITLSLDNEDGTLLPSPAEEDLWYDKIIKAYYSVKVDGEWVDTQIGEFFIDSLSQDDFPDVLTIQGRDRVKQLEKDSFDEAISFAANLTPEAVIGAIATNGGITKMSLPFTGRTLQTVFTFESGVSRWKAIYDIALAFNYEVYFDAYGWLRMRPNQDPITSPLAGTVSYGRNLATYTRVTNDTNLYNVVRVEATRSNQLPIVAVAENNDPSSPSRIGRIRRRVKDIKSQFISTQQDAQALADSLLPVYSLESFEVTWQGLVIPWLDAGDVIAIEDPDDPNLPGRFLLTDFELPMNLGMMSGTGKRLWAVL